ncbi:MAG TPA: OmpA family protein [Polyangiaceae bacterium]|nr:OmpA family protein [Polyangiaceae bacterium]
MPPSRATARRALSALALAFIGLASRVAAAQAEDETELVTWGSGGTDAGLGVSALGHIGLGYRLNETPYGEPFEPAGALYGITGFVKPIRWLSLGLGYEHHDLGQDRRDTPPTSFTDVERDLNTLWALARFYPVRTTSIGLYIGFGGGAAWQSLDTSTAALDPTSSNAVATSTCSGNDAASLGFRGSVGAEIPLRFGVVFMGEVGVDRYQLSGDSLDGCALGAGDASLATFRLGFAYGLESAKKPKKPPPPPPPPSDRDNDTIFEPYDACPDVPGVTSKEPSKNGCPLPKDTDGDSFLDPVDACPEVAGVASPEPSKNGCPPPKDTDGDGVIDEQDACVEIPGVRTPSPATNGCPGDTDGDGFRDDKDACPTEKGVANDDPAKNGCPAVQLTQAEIVINQQVQFDTNLATIKEVSFGLLDEVARIIKEHPEVARVEVQGHTDTEGARAHNLLLSQRRADSVRKALIKRGVDFQRLDSKGYGPDVPIADNATPEGRSKNRRVQFKITQKKAQGDAKPTDAKPTDAKPTDAKPTDAKPTDAKPTDAKPTDAKPTDAKPTGATPAPKTPVEAAKPAPKNPVEATPKTPVEAPPAEKKP